MAKCIKPELNITVIRRAARMMLASGGDKGCNRCIRAYRDLLVTTVRMRRRKLKECAEGKG